jgi:dipeptide/tripeptide permease
MGLVAHRRLKEYVKWFGMGFIVHGVSYALFLVFYHYTGNKHLSYWSWVLASPFMYEVWKIVEGRELKKKLKEYRDEV